MWPETPLSTGTVLAHPNGTVFDITGLFFDLTIQAVTFEHRGWDYLRLII